MPRTPNSAALAFALGVALGAAPLTLRAAPAGDLQTLVLEGTLGAYPVGASLQVRGAREVVGGHYYYGRHPIDIPLTVRSAGPALVTLREPGGAVFELHLTGNGSEHGKPLDFSTSVALDGRWTQGPKSLPVHLGFSTMFEGAGPDHRYADVTREPDAGFEARVQRFVTAVLANDRPAAAGAVSYPLTVNGAPRRVIRDRAQLLAQWDAIFTPALIQQFRKAIPHEMFARNGQAMIANGAVWFDAKGAASINPPL